MAASVELQASRKFDCHREHSKLKEAFIKSQQLS